MQQITERDHKIQERCELQDKVENVLYKINSKTSGKRIFRPDGFLPSVTSRLLRNRHEHTHCTTSRAARDVTMRQASDLIKKRLFCARCPIADQSVGLPATVNPHTRLPESERVTTCTHVVHILNTAWAPTLSAPPLRVVCVRVPHI